MNRLVLWAKMVERGKERLTYWRPLVLLQLFKLLYTASRGGRDIDTRQLPFGTVMTDRKRIATSGRVKSQFGHNASITQ